jgi:hypothetical protein
VHHALCSACIYEAPHQGVKTYVPQGIAGLDAILAGGAAAREMTIGLGPLYGTSRTT